MNRHTQNNLRLVSLPTRGAWIEIPVIGGMFAVSLSLPTRGAWIEIRSINILSFMV